ncbi:hypothetical protein GS426_00485 [Rhodococcus hoagii]|nr:hypothetical protein [Prescottella equi]
MGSAEFIPYLDFIADFAGAAADLFGALSFFSDPRNLPASCSARRLLNRAGVPLRLHRARSDTPARPRSTCDRTDRMSIE